MRAFCDSLIVSRQRRPPNQLAHSIPCFNWRSLVFVCFFFVSIALSILCCCVLSGCVCYDYNILDTVQTTHATRSRTFCAKSIAAGKLPREQRVKVNARIVFVFVDFHVCHYIWWFAVQPSIFVFILAASEEERTHDTFFKVFFCCRFLVTL